MTAGFADELTSQLAGLSRHRLPLADGLRALAEDCSHAKRRRQYLKLASLVESGTPMNDAIRTSSDPRLAPLAAVYESSLSPQTQLQLLVIWNRQLEMLGDLTRRMRAALWYPLTIAALALVISVWLTSLFARVVAVFRDWGVTGVPWYLELMGDFGENWLRFLPLLVGCVVFAAVAIFLGVPRHDRHRLLGTIPVIGALLRWCLWSSYFSALAALVAARIPLPEAARVLARQFYHSGLRRPASQLAGQVANGVSFADACRRIRGFPYGLIALAQAADSPADATRTLSAMAEICRERFLIWARFANRVIPLCVLAVTGLVICIELAGLGAVVVSLITGLAS